MIYYDLLDWAIWMDVYIAQCSELKSPEPCGSVFHKSKKWHIAIFQYIKFDQLLCFIYQSVLLSEKAAIISYLAKDIE